jgi:hypothetical protein
MCPQGKACKQWPQRYRNSLPGTPYRLQQHLVQNRHCKLPLPFRTRQKDSKTTNMT